MLDRKADRTSQLLIMHLKLIQPVDQPFGALARRVGYHVESLERDGDGGTTGIRNDFERDGDQVATCYFPLGASLAARAQIQTRNRWIRQTNANQETELGETMGWDGNKMDIHGEEKHERQRQKQEPATTSVSQQAYRVGVKTGGSA